MSAKKSYLERGTGPPLVFLHGIGGNAATWTCQLEAFANDYRVIALDLPGYGGSAALPAATFPAYARWLGEFLDEHQIVQPVLIGHSFGGMIVQEFLALYPGRVRAVVLYATSPAFGRKDGAWQQKFIEARLGPLDAGKTMAELAPGIVKGLTGSGASVAGIALARQGVAAVPEATFRQTVLCLVEFDRRDNLANLDIPCLVIVGEEDTNAPPAMMEKMAGRIPKAQFCCLPRLGHLAHLEDAVRFNDVLRAFLAE